MATSTTLRSSAPAPSQRRRLALRSVVAVVVLVLACLAVLIGFRLARSGVLPNVQVADVQLGGRDEPGLREALAGYGERRAGKRVTVERGDERVTTTAGDLGYELDVDATAAAVWERGRQANPITALSDHVRATFGDRTSVAPVESLDQGALDAWVGEAVEALALDPVEGAIAFRDGEVVRTDPEPGARVLADPLRAEVEEALARTGAQTLGAPTEAIEPVTTTEDVEAVLPAAEQAMSGPVSLERGDASLTLSPEEIGQVLAVELDADADPKLVVTADPEVLAELVPDDTVDAFNVAPRDATFSVSDGEVSIEGSRDGFRFDPQLAADQVREVATGDGEREVGLAGEVVAPDRSTEDAEALEIVERVSTFTTNHACCQGRVQNIQRFADLVDGVVIEPDETFSLNDHVGERTRAKGFVEGGAIFEGEFISAVGGGVSQFATTFYNAAYFGGYEFVEYKAHSYYISRYPMGREATVDYPGVDLEIRNNSPHGILVQTSYTSTSITVSFYGKQWVDVESQTGSPRNYTSAQTEVRSNPNLPSGREVVVQSGGSGFDVIDVRVLTFPDGRVEREEFFTRYLAEPRIIERGTG